MGIETHASVQLPQQKLLFGSCGKKAWFQALSYFFLIFLLFFLYFVTNCGTGIFIRVWKSSRGVQKWTATFLSDSTSFWSTYLKSSNVSVTIINTFIKKLIQCHLLTIHSLKKNVKITPTYIWLVNAMILYLRVFQQKNHWCRNYLT